MGGAASTTITFETSRTAGPGEVSWVDKRATDERSAEQLRHERSVLARVQHPGIVQLAAAPESGLLRTVDAGTATLASHPPRDVSDAVAALVQLASTLADLHERGIAHGGVAAEHCIRTPRGAMVLCSLRRARPVSGSDAAAARQDVAALVALARSWWIESSSDPLRRAAGRRLRLLLDDPPATARALAAAVDAAGGAGRAPARPGHRRPVRRHHRRHGRVAGAVLRSIGLVVLAGLVAGVRGPDSSGGLRVVGDLPPVVASVLVILRWLAVAGALYAAALNALAAAALRSTDQRWERALARLGPGPLRRWCTGVAALGATIAAAGAPGSAHHGDAPGIAALQPARSSPTSTTPPAPTPQPEVAPRPTAPHPPVTPAAPEPARPRAALTYILRAGDHLWSVAERAGHLALGRAPTDAETTAYWRRLIDANRDVLADPAEPDVVYAGQVVTLPPWDPAVG